MSVAIPPSDARTVRSARRDGGAAEHGSARADHASFLGRARELAELSELVDERRLITLTGPPGIGKSRLARELALVITESTERVAALVELAPLGDGAQIPAAVATALSIKETPGQSLTDTLVARLAKRPILLVLDNCEHLLENCTSLVAVLLDGCPNLSVLATSRQPLGVPGETVWHVPPLPVPGEPAGKEADELIEYTAVRLFTERARSVEPRFALNAYVAPAVVEICCRLDGLPLAIELAATRIEQLTPTEIAGRLDDRFKLLIATEPSGHARHDTLAAALELSYDLLSEDERSLLRALSVFPGDFEQAACAQVCGAEVGLLEGLVVKSLVVHDLATDRYRLLETIRAYARERLEEAGETAARREEHARFYVGLAERAEPELTGPAQEGWFERLDLERPNLRAALEWSVGHGREEWALGMTGALVLFWRVRSLFSEGREWLEAALHARHGIADARLEAKALWGAGFIANWAGDNDAAIPLAEESLRLYEELHDGQGRARALLTLGGCHQETDTRAAIALFEESAAIAREADDWWCAVHALGAAGFCDLAAGPGDSAREMFEECLALARRAQDKQSLRVPLVGLAQIAFSHGDYRVAEPLFEEALAVAEDLGDDYTQAWALRHLGATVEGWDQPRACELFDRAIALVRDLRPADLVSPLVSRARLARAEGDFEHARLLLEEASTLARPGSRDACVALVGMGTLVDEEGDTRAARRLFEEALDRARSAGAEDVVALSLHALGRLERVEGGRRRAMLLHNEALEIHRRHTNLHGICVSLEAIGGLAAEANRAEHAALLIGAAETLRERNGYYRSPPERDRYERDLERIRQSLPGPVFASPFKRGAALSVEEAVAKGLDVSNGTERRAKGWDSLMQTERQIAALVAEGLTNAEIAERLFISLGTVKDHLKRIFSKLGVTARTELAREVGRWDRNQEG